MKHQGQQREGIPNSGMGSKYARRRLFAQGKRAVEKKSYKEGIRLLQNAASLGHLNARVWLGAIYDYGIGTLANRKLAFSHYRTAAEEGSAEAEYHVGVFYYEGVAVRKNYKEAVIWLKRAALHGDADAVHLLAQCYR